MIKAISQMRITIVKFLDKVLEVYFGKEGKCDEANKSRGCSWASFMP